MQPIPPESCNAGKLALNAGRYAESLRLYQDCLATDGLSREVRIDTQFNTGRALEGLQRYDEAAEHFAQVVELVPDYAPATLALANALESVGKYEEALTALNAFDALVPQARNAALLEVRGRLMLDMNDPESAIADLDRAIELDPQNEQAFANRALARSYLGDYDGTLVDAETALALAPKDPMALYLRAEQLNLRRRFEEARRDLEAMLTIVPENAEAHRELGTTLFQLGHGQESLTELNRAIEIDPQSGLYHAVRGYVRLRLGDSAAALTDFDRALADQSPNYTWYFYRAHAFAWLDRQKEARRDIEAGFALMSEKEKRWHSNEICWDLLLEGRTELAAPLCKQAVTLAGDAPSLDSRAFLYWQLGQTNRAEADLARAQSVARNPPFFEPKKRLAEFPVTLAQGLLTFLGYRPDLPDTGSAARTRQAIMAFQHDHGLDVTGKATPALIEALKAARP